MRVGARVDQLRIYLHPTPGPAARFPPAHEPPRVPVRSGADCDQSSLDSCITLIRLITFRSAIFASSVKISSWTPSAKNPFSWSALRFSNGSTAMLFSGIVRHSGRRARGHPKLRPVGSGEFLKARIIPKWIEHRIKPEQRGSERQLSLHWAGIGTESSFSDSGNRAVGLSHACAPPGLKSPAAGHQSKRLFRSDSQVHGPLGQSQRSGFVAKAHIAQRERANEEIISRLLFEQRFQFAAGLSPTFVGGGNGRQPLLAPSPGKSVVLQCYNPALDQDWPILPLAE